MNDNDAARHDFEHVLSVVQEQMRDLAVLQQRRSEITAKASAADGTVEVTVDAQRMVIKTVIDESYVGEFELADLGGHVTAAAQQAAREVENLSAALLRPLMARREEILSLSGLAEMPVFGDVVAGLGDVGVVGRPGVSDEELSYPVVGDER